MLRLASLQPSTAAAPLLRGMGGTTSIVAGPLLAPLIAPSSSTLPAVANVSEQRRSIHTHRSVFNLYQELEGWGAQWPLRPPAAEGADDGCSSAACASASSSAGLPPSERQGGGGRGASRAGSSSMGGGVVGGRSSSQKRYLTTSADHWSPLLIAEFISAAVTQQSAVDFRTGRTVHPSAFVDNLPWSFYSAGRLATVPRLRHFAGGEDGHSGNGNNPGGRGGRGGGGGDVHRVLGARFDTANTATSSSASPSSYSDGPMVLMYHGSPCGIDILKRGARFMHNSDDAQGIYLSPSLACARGYAGIRRVDISVGKPSRRRGSSASVVGAAGNGGVGGAGSDLPMPSSYEDDWWNSSIASVSDAALRQRAVLVCLASLGKVYHRYAGPDAAAEALIANGQWAIEGTSASDAAANAAASSTAELGSQPRQSAHSSIGGGDSHFGYGHSPSGCGRQQQQQQRRVFRNPNDDPDRPYDSYVDFVDGEQIYCVRNPDNIIPIVALAINKQSLGQA